MTGNFDGTTRFLRDFLAGQGGLVFRRGLQGRLVMRRSVVVESRWQFWRYELGMNIADGEVGGESTLVEGWW